MLLILDLASQLNKNLHFNHFQSVLGYEYMQGQGWNKATSLEPSAEKDSVSQPEAPAQVTIQSFPFKLTLIGCRSPGKEEIREGTGYVTTEGEVAKFLPLLFCYSKSPIAWGVGAQKGISHFCGPHYEKCM